MIAQLYAMKETRGYLIAYLFRLYISLYAIAVLSYCHVTDWVANMIFISVSIINLLLSLAFVKFSVNTMRWANTVGDVLIVGIFFYFYGILDTYSQVVALLPLIGNVCLSDLHFSKWLALAIPLAISCALYLKDALALMSILLPFGIIGVIVMFGNIHQNLNLKIVRIGEFLDSFFISKENLQKPNLVYDKIIELLGQRPLPVTIDAVYCFLMVDKLYLYNGSRYVWSYQFIDQVETMTSQHQVPLKEYENFPLIINGKNINSGSRYTISLGKNTGYVFIVEGEEVNTFTKMLVDITLHSLFSKLAKLYESERLQRKIESDQLITLSEKANYVHAAVHSLHYMRNKLSSVKTLLSISDDIAKEIDEQKRVKMFGYLDKDIQKIRESYNMMIERANFILDDNETPFVYCITQRYALKNLVSELRRSWQTYGLEESAISIHLLNGTEGGNCYLCYNKEGLGLVLDNWISNIKKYSNENYSLELTENEQNIVLVFSNGYDPKDKLDFIDCYSNDNKAEINKNKWHGISNIKEFLDQMHIQGEMSHDNKNIFFKITFSKTICDEESIGN